HFCRKHKSGNRKSSVINSQSTINSELETLNPKLSTSNLLPHLAILGANLIYGVNYSIAKDVMPAYIQPFGFIFYRVLGALFLFGIVASFFKEKIAKKDMLLLAVCGFFGVGLNQL